ncbi:hypothetical protein VOLCADRAFT_95258 [Volvox carteri f. nagariensis]|uniref:Nuclear pore complex protein Nup85 n=1 Tax=Volvox carteri f. nagariensis TaxID=3068 RepID=D8U711_VOLCA|nr:uncharacterized protein VOLCADRAFT_95258 [Volvox carteri f. nagariensis]EFJ44604.1 hypothetical protein VOLCADRAFT_95258 [Volvox carteri f. nagariensis]|eukprot:XP_002954454.1 hypothetical protein VOLCADRAFT_95258 [Volvox carteri f. nagariensis]
MSGGEPTLEVPVSRGSRLHFSWGLGSELRLLDIQNPNTEQGGNAGSATRVCWGQANSNSRAISFGTAEQYAEVQRSRLSGARDDAHLARVASYARTIREQLMGAREEIQSDGGQSHLEVALWHLMEIFFVDAPRHEGNLGEASACGYDFVQWLASHSEVLEVVSERVPLAKRLQDVVSSPSPDTHPGYWGVLRRLAALGRISEAMELLDCHEVRRAVTGGGQRGGGAAAAAALQQPGVRAQVELTDCLFVLLKRLPRLAPSSGCRDPRAHSSLADFAAARAVWLREVQDIAGSEGLFAAAGAASRRTAEGVRSVLAILLGQPTALRAATRDWLELAAAEVVHRQAGGVVAANQLKALLAECQAAVAAARREGEGEGGSGGGGDSSGLLNWLAGLLEALTEMDIAGVVSELTTSGLGLGWLLAHSLELMAAYPAGGGGGGGGGAARAGGGGGGVLTQRLAVSGCDQMEYFRLAWADSLLPNCMSGGWQLVLQYLAWCPQHGAAAVEALMEALPVDSRDVRTLEKALAACRRLGLGGSAAVLCRMAGVDALSRGHLGSGVQWMVRAGDTRRTAAALQLVGVAVEEALLARLGIYQAGALALPGGGELEALLEWLPVVGGEAGGGGGEEAAGGGGGGGGGGRGLTSFLGDVLRLSQAMGALAAARDSGAPPDDPATLGSLAAGHAAFMSMVRRRTPPRRLCLPLLFYAIPLLEASAGGGRLFSTDDVQLLRQWASDCARGAVATSIGTAAGSGGSGGTGGPMGALAAMLRVHDRYARDVQLALVRATARSHVLQYSGGGSGCGGALGGLGGSGGVGAAAAGGGGGGGAALMLPS